MSGMKKITREFLLNTGYFDSKVNTLTDHYLKAKETLIKNLLSQLGYDLEEVLSTKGQCIKEDIHWESVAFEQCDYICLNGKRVGEVRLVNEMNSVSYEVKVYGK